MQTPKHTRRGGRRTELIVVVLILGVAIIVVWPAIMRRPGRGHSSTRCKNHLSYLGKATFLYEGSEQGKLSPDDWEHQLRPYVDDEDDVFRCYARKEGMRFGGEHSYAFNSKAPLFGDNDQEKIVLIESDHRLIEIDNLDCTEATVRGRPVSRHSGTVNALLYSGHVRAYELDEIMPDNAETLRQFWLPAAENGKICGPVTVVD